jgi:hypothetical protein
MLLKSYQQASCHWPSMASVLWWVLSITLDLTLVDHWMTAAPETSCCILVMNLSAYFKKIQPAKLSVELVFFFFFFSRPCVVLNFLLLSLVPIPNIPVLHFNLKLLSNLTATFWLCNFVLVLTAPCRSFGLKNFLLNLHLLFGRQISYCRGHV